MPRDLDGAIDRLHASMLRFRERQRQQQLAEREARRPRFGAERIYQPTKLLNDSQRGATSPLGGQAKGK